MTTAVRGLADYSRLLVHPDEPGPGWSTEQQVRLHEKLMGCAAVFAENCRSAPNPRFVHDPNRSAALRYGRGLGADESAGFLRALDAGLVTLQPDGGFFTPAARACSPNLHLVGRNEDHVVLHTEVLIHVTAYAELVLDHGWDPGQLVFDPFVRNAALDLWGFDSRPSSSNWWEGNITFVAEAKARVGGADSLTSLLTTLQRLEIDPDAQVNRGQRRKWDELVSIVHQHGDVRLLLIADGARWWYSARRSADGVLLTTEPVTP